MQRNTYTTNISYIFIDLNSNDWSVFLFWNHFIYELHRFNSAFCTRLDAEKYILKTKRTNNYTTIWESDRIMA